MGEAFITRRGGGGGNFKESTHLLSQRKTYSPGDTIGTFEKGDYSGYVVEIIAAGTNAAPYIFVLDKNMNVLYAKRHLYNGIGDISAVEWFTLSVSGETCTMACGDLWAKSTSLVIVVLGIK